MQPSEPHDDERFANTARYPHRREIAALLVQQRITAASECRLHYRLAWLWLAAAVGSFCLSMWPMPPGWLRVFLFIFAIIAGVVSMNNWAEAISQASIFELYPEDLSEPSVAPTPAIGLLPRIGIFFGFKW